MFVVLSFSLWERRCLGSKRWEFLLFSWGWYHRSFRLVCEQLQRTNLGVKIYAITKDIQERIKINTIGC